LQGFVETQMLHQRFKKRTNAADLYQEDNDADLGGADETAGNVGP